eukprot:SAG31_NODE_107_length_24865_cov_17.973593_14_plen_217_part_00
MTAEGIIIGEMGSENEGQARICGKICSQWEALVDTGQEVGWINASRVPYAYYAPEWGGVALRRDAGYHAAQLNFESNHDGYYHHATMTANAITLSFMGYTLLDHKRYERTAGRNWGAHSSSWNMVTINQDVPWLFGRTPPAPLSNSLEEGAAFFAQGGDVVLFDGGGPSIRGISLAESDARHCYIPYTSRYSRLVIHNTFDGGEMPFVLCPILATP